MADSVTITWTGGEVSGRLTGDGHNGILLAHGAGVAQDHPFMVLLRDGLAGDGHTVMTFNYPYTERGSKSPDRAEKLIECHRGAAEFLRPQVENLFLAGRSMGGRIATMLVAEGGKTAGIVLYAYPLHPAGKPEKLRIDHLSNVTVPLLFFLGTRDALSRIELFDQHIRSLPNAEVEVLENASHSPKGGGWTFESTVERLVAGTSEWIGRISSGSSNPETP
ncbi:MAG: alpha/beta family hydrolase [Acidimicrobiia bacterium]